jgi:hypothetical protein
MRVVVYPLEVVELAKQEGIIISDLQAQEFIAAHAAKLERILTVSGHDFIKTWLKEEHGR